MHKFLSFLKRLLGTVSISLWALKFGFKISPFWLGSRFVTYTASELLNILETFLAASLLQEVVNIIGASTNKFTDHLIILIASYFIVMFISPLLNHFDAYSTQIYNIIFTEKAVALYIRQLNNLDIQYHEDPSFKTLSEKAQEVLAWRAQTMIEKIISLTAGVIGAVSLVAIFTAVSPIFLILIAIPVILNLIIENKYGKNIYDIWSWQGDDKKEAVKAYNAFEDKSVLFEARIYGFGKYISDKFVLVTRRFAKTLKSNINKKFSLLILSSMLDVFILIGFQVWIIYQTIIGIFTLQIYSFYIQNLYYLSGNLSGLQNHYSRISEFGLYMRDFKTFLNMPDKIQKPIKGVKLSAVAPLIEFKNVNFKYPGSENLILNNLDFKIEPGQKIALVGENGAGKTTLIKLLARFYDPTEGDIYINNQNLKNLDLESYYKLWGILFQQFARYWFTLRENIGLGNVEDIENKSLIEEAANKSGLEKVIAKLPNGLENMLSTDFENGKDLSGGEWQKVGIARGFFANPKLIILDEPTSALDALAEQEVFDEIQKISNDTTMIIVSHRFATVRNADKILVLEQGAISEQGTHEELMARKGLYYKMFSTQAEGYK